MVGDGVYMLWDNVMVRISFFLHYLHGSGIQLPKLLLKHYARRIKWFKANVERRQSHQGLNIILITATRPTQGRLILFVSHISC